ncbi:MAG: isocitrate lyase/PEP mutase family protein [Candidatus Nitrosocaldus sp.]|nr:isocitrate lyase/PEP mutase family protein [Candidatus Nitrosocaldus sp.]MDW7999403.1 isocitrate lyase/PEP mutase family protein [Candidatus Nitrosocaldus sp.]
MLLSRIRGGESVVVPGVYDALSARIAEQVGFEAVFQSGYSVAASMLGLPDYGLLNANEVVEQARRIASSVSIPLIVDIDTGYGNALNVRRVVQELERAGAKGVFLEDQVWPKRCGHMQGKQVIPVEEYMQKLYAALDARSSSEFIVVARTDALEPLGIDEAIERANMYADAGADLVFVEAPRSVEEMRRICREVRAPMVANMIEGGRTPLLSVSELRAIGYRFILFPLTALLSAAYAMREMLSLLKADTLVDAVKRDSRRMLIFDEFNRLIGLDGLKSIEARYARTSSRHHQ